MMWLQKAIIIPRTCLEALYEEVGTLNDDAILVKEEWKNETTK
jgi:hypothetical protein